MGKGRSATVECRSESGSSTRLKRERLRECRKLVTWAASYISHPCSSHHLPAASSSHLASQHGGQLAHTDMDTRLPGRLGQTNFRVALDVHGH